MTYMTYMTYITYVTYITYISYITYITYITDSTYSTYMTYRTYMTYITGITDTLHFLRFQSMTRHDMTLLHILTYGSCAHGKGKGTEEKKAELCTFMLPEVTNTSNLKPMLSHLHAGLSLAYSVASLSTSQSLHLPNYPDLLHDSLADCKLKGDELPT